MKTVSEVEKVSLRNFLALDLDQQLEILRLLDGQTREQLEKSIPLDVEGKLIIREVERLRGLLKTKAISAQPKKKAQYQKPLHPVQSAPETQKKTTAAPRQLNNHLQEQVVVSNQKLSSQQLSQTPKSVALSHLAVHPSSLPRPATEKKDNNQEESNKSGAFEGDRMTYRAVISGLGKEEPLPLLNDKKNPSSKPQRAPKEKTAFQDRLRRLWRKTPALLLASSALALSSLYVIRLFYPQGFSQVQGLVLILIGLISAFIWIRMSEEIQ